VKATVAVEPLSILLSPEEPGDGKVLTELMRVIDRRPFVAEEVADVIGGPTRFGDEPQPNGVRIRLAVSPSITLDSGRPMLGICSTCGVNLDALVAAGYEGHACFGDQKTAEDERDRLAAFVIANRAVLEKAKHIASLWAVQEGISGTALDELVELVFPNGAPS
jgi:hypothetical protein